MRSETSNFVTVNDKSIKWKIVQTPVRKSNCEWFPAWEINSQYHSLTPQQAHKSGFRWVFIKNAARIKDRVCGGEGAILGETTEWKNIYFINRYLGWQLLCLLSIF